MLVYANVIRRCRCIDVCMLSKATQVGKMLLLFNDHVDFVQLHLLRSAWSLWYGFDPPC